MTSHTMGDPVTQGQFFQAIQDLDEKGQQRHQRIRESMEDGFRRLELKLEEHAKEDRTVADEVIKIRERETSRDSATARRTVWTSILVALPGALLALYALLHVGAK